MLRKYLRITRQRPCDTLRFRKEDILPAAAFISRCVFYNLKQHHHFIDGAVFRKKYRYRLSHILHFFIPSKVGQNIAGEGICQEEDIYQNNQIYSECI